MAIIGELQSAFSSHVKRLLEGVYLEDNSNTTIQCSHQNVNTVILWNFNIEIIVQISYHKSANDFESNSGFSIPPP